MTVGNEEVRAQIAARLRAEMGRLGLTPETLAKPAGVDKSTVYNYLNGARVPDAVFLVNARVNARLDVQFVLTGEKERHTLPLSDIERQTLDRLADLPAQLRQTVDDVLLLAWLAADSRRSYDHGPDAETKYPAAASQPALQLHEPAPKRMSSRKHV